PLDAALHRACVVERNRDRHVDDRLRNSSAVRQRVVVLPIADPVVRNADRDHHVIVVAVIRPENLDDRVATGARACDPDRVHRRLGAGAHEAPRRQSPPTCELLRDDHAVLRGRGEVRPERDTLAHRFHDRRVRMALHHGAKGVVEIDQLVAVDVPDVRSLSAEEVDRPRLALLIRGGHAVHQGRTRAFEERCGGGRPALQPALLALGQRGDSLAVELQLGRCAHRRILSVSTRNVMISSLSVMARDLRPLFEPRSVAVVGASNDPAKWGQWFARGALAGAHRRAVYLVNRSGGNVLGQPAYRSLAELPQPPELVILAVPAAAFGGATDGALAAGARAIVAIAAGLGETGEQGRARERAVVARVREAGAVLLGPNCLGVYDGSSELDLSLSDFTPGTVSLISQSGNLAIEISLLAREVGLGIARFASLGNH